MDKKKKRTFYAVKLGSTFYVRPSFASEGSASSFEWDEDDLTIHASSAGRYELRDVPIAAEVAKELGGTIVKLKTKLKRVVTSVSSG